MAKLFNHIWISTSYKENIKRKLYLNFYFHDNSLALVFVIEG